MAEWLIAGVLKTLTGASTARRGFESRLLHQEPEQALKPAPAMTISGIWRTHIAARCLKGTLGAITPLAIGAVNPPETAPFSVLVGVWAIIPGDSNDRVCGDRPGYQAGPDLPRRQAHARNCRGFHDRSIGAADNRVHISSDSLHSYVDAVEWAFGADVDFQQEAGKLAGVGRPAFRPLQSRSTAQDLARYAGYGSERERIGRISWRNWWKGTFRMTEKEKLLWISTA